MRGLFVGINLWYRGYLNGSYGTYTLHGTGARNGTGKQIGYYILCRTVHITLEQGTGPDTIGFHKKNSVLTPGPGSVQCVWTITSISDNKSLLMFTSLLATDVQYTQVALWMSVS